MRTPSPTRSVLRPHLRAAAWPLVALGVLQTLSVAGTLYLPHLNARIIDEGVTRGDLDTVWRLGSVMAVLAVLQLLIAGTATALGAYISVRIARDLRAALFQHVMRLGTADVRGFTPASLITRCGNDVVQVQMLVLTMCTTVLTVPITMIGAVVMGLREEPRLTWLMAVAVPALVLVVLGFAWLALPKYRRMQPQIDRVNAVLREQLTGLRDVRAANREDHEQRRFEQVNSALIDTSLSVGRLYLSFGPIVALLMNLGAVAVVWFGGHQAAAGEIGVGSVLAFISYLLMLMSAVLMASTVVMLLPRARVSSQRIAEVLHTPPESTTVAGGTPWRDPELGIEVRGATVRHPGAEQPALREVELRVRPGERLAVVGSTGSGKTTLLQAISRQISIDSGQISLDGTDLESADLVDLRRRVVLVPQRPYLFSGTIRSALSYGKPDADEERLWQALRWARAERIVTDLPAGLDSPVAPGGTNFSGGQRQRLCLARALVADADYYLLDDVTSALDATTEAEVARGLARATADAGVVQVTQRIASVAEADRILVLDRGTVVGEGNHDDLLGTCSTYREFVESQSLEETTA
ncbi:ATP-binding cassette, subfamily B [Actinopolyspora xinjiangensis]|uniref:ATP-binding cassette, subfamily B n=1 Tax=Actinopolyspora xinjiangensis TaxID=405564 RepID=A0A1H0V8A5_9ACTN|nr:ABC transporter ATP-binding protein [Actinopolyspora xinjiangensis]SDP74637.1 ATP-binding cassette, subfamily B [Actinopolyspora xinjiangensis]